MSLNLHGIYPPCATPFKDGEIDTAGLAHNARRWMKTGLRGLLALGSNGEAAFLDEDEAERVVATLREHTPRDRVLLAGTGRQSTRATIAATCPTSPFESFWPTMLGCSASAATVSGVRLMPVTLVKL